MKIRKLTGIVSVAATAWIAATVTASATIEPLINALTPVSGAADTGVIVSMAVVVLAAFGMVMFGRDRQPEPVRVRTNR